MGAQVPHNTISCEKCSENVAKHQYQTKTITLVILNLGLKTP